MNLLTADAETFWAADYTLSSLTTEAYVRDPRFQEILWGLKWNDTPAFWIGPDRFKAWVREVDWSRVILVCHHSHFDGFILSYHHDVKPGLHVDTLSMARVLDGPKAGNSLDQLATRHGVGQKGFATQWSKGKRLEDFTADEYARYGAYCVNDVEITHRLAQKFMPQLPAEEIRLIDLTIRMFTEPVFQGDTEKLAGAVTSERERKAGLLRRIGQLCLKCEGSGRDPQARLLVGDADGFSCSLCDGTGVNKKVIGSNEAFAGLLRSFGVEPELKPSPSVVNEDGTPAMNYAFAKTDPAMQALLEDDNEEVRFLAEARIAVKSSIIETRAQRFHDCASRGPMPVYIKHAGAHTLRPSGGDGLNWLNMSNDIEDAPRPEMAVLKQSIMAPPGYKIVAADSSQGEARILSYIAGQDDLTAAFAAGNDVYSEFASMVYGRSVDRKNVKADYIPGQVGKIGILSFGFGSGYYTAALGFAKGVLGAPPIQFTEADMVAMQVDPSPFLANPTNIRRVSEMPSRLELTDRLVHCAVTKALVDRYRARYSKIKEFWTTMEHAISAMIDGREMTFGPGGIFRVAKERIYGPTGLWLDYRGIARDEHGDASYFDGRSRTKIYGSLLCENVVQHMHRLIVGDQALEIAQECKVALWPYDELVCVVPDTAAELALQFMKSVMARSPAWAPTLPLSASGAIGSTYAECK